MLFERKKSVMLLAMPLAAICIEVLAQTKEPESSAGMVSPPVLIHEIDISPYTIQKVLAGRPLQNRPESISWNPDGTRMAVELEDAVQIFDMTHPATPGLLYILNQAKTRTYSHGPAAYNDDGSQLWVRDWGVGVWRKSHYLNYTVCDGINPTLFQKSYTIVPSNERIDEFAFSRNRKQLAVAHLKTPIKIYEMTYPESLQALFDKRDAINPSLFNRWIGWLLPLLPHIPVSHDLPLHGASDTSSQTVYSTSLLHTLHHEEEWWLVKDVAFNNDGSRLAVGYATGYVAIFDTSARSGKESSCANFNREKWWNKKNSFTKKHSGLPLHALIATSQTGSPRRCRELCNYRVWKLAYNHDGSRLAVLDGSGTVNVYDGMNPVSPLYTLKGAWSIAFSHDGSLLAVGGHDKVSIYQVGGDTAGSQPAAD